MPQAGELTPMLRHYLEVKAQYPDALLLYRMGDFYELFFDDAERAAPILEVTLTARQRGTDNEAPMCGVPHHAVGTYVGKLLREGLKVAICEQIEDPAQARGLVRREVTRVLTPGTVSDPDFLEGTEASLLAGLAWSGANAGENAEPRAASDGAGAFLDITTGRFYVRRWRSVDEGLDDLRSLRPREVLLASPELPAELSTWLAQAGICATVAHDDRWFDRQRASALLERQLGLATLRGLGLMDGEPAVLAAAAALGYARATQKSDLAHVRELVVRGEDDAMVLDATTIANLEIFRNVRRGGRAGTLLGVVDRTVSPAGGRLLKEWLRRPLRDPAAISARQEAVAALLADGAARERLRGELAASGDPERLLARAVLGTLAPREAAALRECLLRAPAVLAEAARLEAPLLLALGATDSVADLAAELARSLAPEPAAALAAGGVIASGVDPELDRVRSLAHDSKRHILGIEQRERERTGIASLKIRYNKIFGYYLEIGKAHESRVPPEYTRKQTLVKAERYVTPEIKDLEEQILAAQQRQIALEEEHFARLRAAVVDAGPRLAVLAQALALLDATASFAEVAERKRYCRPGILPAGGAILIREGRHPVVEDARGEPFVPNDCELSPETAQIVLLTGPNMGGKSTYLRQVALVVVLAQAGSFVPAESAVIGAVDRIFTRVGASDDLARGESTFMVEMVETARILHQATAHSLVILDEVGRGTATLDGLALAWAIVEDLHQRRRPLTLFATHYLELTELAGLLPRVVNRTMAVKEWHDRIVFLRRLVAGSADKSYGLHVARLAGVPATVVERAAVILRNLEAQEVDLAGRPRLARGIEGATAAGPDQLQLFAPAEEIVVSILREVDLERLSPLAALNLLHSLKRRLGE